MWRLEDPQGAKNWHRGAPEKTRGLRCWIMGSVEGWVQEVKELCTPALRRKWQGPFGAHEDELHRGSHMEIFWASPARDKGFCCLALFFLWKPRKGVASYTHLPGPAQNWDEWPNLSLKRKISEEQKTFAVNFKCFSVLILNSAVLVFSPGCQMNSRQHLPCEI